MKKPEKKTSILFRFFQPPRVKVRPKPVNPPASYSKSIPLVVKTNKRRKLVNAIAPSTLKSLPAANPITPYQEDTLIFSEFYKLMLTANLPITSLELEGVKQIMGLLLQNKIKGTPNFLESLRLTCPKYAAFINTNAISEEQQLANFRDILPFTNVSEITAEYLEKALLDSAALNLKTD